MDDRFSPTWTTVKSVVEDLIQDVSGAEQILVDAFRSVSSLDVNSANNVKLALRTHVVTGNTVPWVLYDTISALLERLPQPTRHLLAAKIRIPTRRSDEHLRVTTDGRWQVSWMLDPSLPDVDDQEVALDWYKPYDRDVAPIVPTAVFDYLAASTVLLRADLTLPAGAVMSVALESALWDALAAVNIPRESTRISYATVKWQVRKRSKYFVIEVEGAEKDPIDFAQVIGTDVDQSFSVEVRRTPGNRGGRDSILELSIDSSLAGFLTSNGIQSVERIPERGLTSAIERGRSNQLECLQFLPSVFDETLISLRNNLVHLPSRGNLHAPIVIPNAGTLMSIDELRQQGTLVSNLLRYVVDVINTVYTSQPQAVQVE